MKNKKIILSSSVIIFTTLIYFIGAAYGLAVPLPDIGAISGQIQSVETAANGAFSALQGLAGTLGYAPGASGGPLFNPGPGLSEAMATVDKLTADVSNMQEEYQNIVINYDKLTHLVNSAENAANSVNSLNEQINSAFNLIPQDLTASDIQGGSIGSIAGSVNSNIGSESAEFQNISSASPAFNPQTFISGYSSSDGGGLSKTVLENGSGTFTEGAIFNSAGNTGNASASFNCSSLGEGYYFDDSGNPVGGCTDLVNGLEADAASSGLYNAGVSAARAHKAEIEGDEFMQEISGNALKNSTNYYAYQSSVLTLIAEENAASLKNLGYMESQLKQIELAKSAEEIKHEHDGALIMPQTGINPGLNFYSETTM
jgi:hypothetical protein